MSRIFVFRSNVHGRRVSERQYMELIGSSCVVVADQHNPSILNSDWLVKTKIVDGKWKVVEPGIVTPAFARCLYANGVEIILEPNRLSVNLAGDDRKLSSGLSDIVRRYVRTLSHIPYKHQGNNFRFLVKMPEVVSALKGKLIRKGAWSAENISKIQAMLQYSGRDCTINLSVESNTVEAENGCGEDKDVLILDFNYHRGCEDSDSVLKAAASWKNDDKDAVRRADRIARDIG